MATLLNSSSNLISTILPPFGTKAQPGLIWDEGMRMFITEQYTSGAGNLYYLGVRFTDRIVVVIHIGLFHSWTYLNGIDLYSFDGNSRRLISKKEYQCYYDEKYVRSEVEIMLKDYIRSQIKLSGKVCNDAEVNDEVMNLVDRSYDSILECSGNDRRMQMAKDLITNIKSSNR